DFHSILHCCEHPIPQIPFLGRVANWPRFIPNSMHSVLFSAHFLFPGLGSDGGNPHFPLTDGGRLQPCSHSFLFSNSQTWKPFNSWSYLGILGPYFA
uniref:Uncharacterized protein n=1 Tax=Cyanistes caeruleus TaxID=156563 RepID=A0A8C0VFI3_CYACU